MDTNTGTILDGTETVVGARERIFERVVSVASGERAEGEPLGDGGKEFCPWDLGIML